MIDDARTLYLEANGIRFAYQRHGDHSASEPIVLIRGLGTQLIEWSPVLIETLAAGGLEIIIFDNRDAGLTSKVNGNYQLVDMAADVVELMGALGFKRFHVFGISLGGMVAQLVGVHFSERVACLFSVMSSSGNPALPRPSGQAQERLRASAGDRAGQIELDAENRLIWGSPGYPETESERRAMAQCAYDRCHCPEGVARQMLAAIEDGSRVTRLKSISVPALIIHGEDDPLIPPASGVDTADAIPGAELQLIPGMGHNIPDRLASDIARRVLVFIAGRSGGRHSPG